MDRWGARGRLPAHVRIHLRRGPSEQSALHRYGAALLFGLARAFRRADPGARCGDRVAPCGRGAPRSSTSRPCCRARWWRSGPLSGVGRPATGARGEARPSRSRCSPLAVVGYAAAERARLGPRAPRAGGCDDCHEREPSRTASGAAPTIIRASRSLHLAALPPAAPVHARPVRLLPALRQVWFNGLIGKLGWLDTHTGTSVIPLGVRHLVIPLSCSRAWRSGGAAPGCVSRWPELLTYAVLAAES